MPEKSWCTFSVTQEITNSDSSGAQAEWSLGW